MDENVDRFFNSYWRGLRRGLPGGSPKRRIAQIFP
jgi:hypothetical protein